MLAFIDIRRLKLILTVQTGKRNSNAKLVTIMKSVARFTVKVNVMTAKVIYDKA